MPQLSGVARLRLSPGEVEKVLREDTERRRKLRLIQVRERAKQFSKNKLEAVRTEKVRQLELLAERIQEEWEVEKQSRISQLEKDYAESLKTIGSAHTQADELDLGLERKEAARLENRRRAEERHDDALDKLHEDKLIQEAESAKITQARNLALAKEKMRARQVASLPPPLKTDVRELLSKAKAAYAVQLTDADTYTYPYTIPADQCIVERNDNSTLDGLVGAEVENERREEITHDNQADINERLEKARVRGAHALKRERMRQHYNNMMSELDVLEKADRKHRQQNLEHIPQALFLPAHVVMERETDRQTQMERKIEDLFSHEHDPVQLRANAPELNYDTTPTVTESTCSSSPADSVPRPPTSKVRDGDSVRGRVPFQNVTNVTPTTSSESTTSDEVDQTGSQKRRKAVLNKMMRRIEEQKDEWQHDEVECHDDSLVIPTGQPADSGKQPPAVVVVPPVSDDKTSSETTNESLEQIPDVTTSDDVSTNEAISQTKVTTSDGDTTTSSQFLERQRKDLLDYMKSLETQIDNLETIRQEKSLLEREEELADRLERKLANQEYSGAETSNTTDSYVPHVSEQEEETQTAAGHGLETEGRYQDKLDGGKICGLRSGTDPSVRRPGESTWDWYLRQRETLGETIKQKLHKLTGSERGFELDSHLEPADDSVNLHQRSPARHVPSTLADSRGLQEFTSPTKRSGADNYFITPDYASGTRGVKKQSDGAKRPHPVYEAQQRPLDVDKPRPMGYIPVTEREMLARGETPSVRYSEHELSRDEYDGDRLRGVPFPTSQYMRPEAQPELPHTSHIAVAGGERFVPVEERERLMRTPLDMISYPHYEDRQRRRTKSREPPVSPPDTQTSTSAPSHLQTELQEHSRTLERLQDMMSSVKADHFVQSRASSNTLRQSYTEPRAVESIVPSSRAMSHSQSMQPEISQSQPVEPGTSQSQPTYMSVNERERLLHTLTQRFLSRETEPTLSSGRPTWGEVLASGTNRDEPDTVIDRMGVPLTRPAPYQAAVTGPRAHDEDHGWSPLHQQMMAKQDEFNRRQEELRRQLADIQEQKRKLLSPSTSRREMLQTQDSIRSTLDSLGIELDNEETCQSTPSAASRSIPLRPPVTAKPGLGDLDPHELSVIQEVDTPTHLTTFDETLYQSMNVNTNARHSQSDGSALEATPRSHESLGVPPILISEPTEVPGTELYTVSLSQDQTQLRQGLSSTSESETGRKPAELPVRERISSGTSSDALTTPCAPEPTAPGSEADFTAGDTTGSPEGERIQVLNQLLQQLEARRAERQMFLEQENLTVLERGLDSAGLSSHGMTADRRSPTLLDLYSSGSADDLAAVHIASSTDSRESTPSGDTLRRQIQQANEQWIEKPVSVPDHVAEGFTSSSDTLTTPSSERQAASQVSQGVSNKSQSGSDPIRSPPTNNTTSSTEESPRVQNIEQLLQNITSDEGSSNEGGQGHTLSLTAQSEQSSPASHAAEMTQVTDQSMGGQSIPQSDRSPQTISGSEGDNSAAADTTSSPVMKTLVADYDLTGLSAADSVGGSPMKTLAAEYDDTGFSTTGYMGEETQSTPMKISLSSRPASSTPHKTNSQQDADQTTGLLEEQEITFASTIPDESNLTLVDESQTAGTDYVQEGVDVGDKEVTSVPGLQWLDTESNAVGGAVSQTEKPVDVRPKTTTKSVDSAARKKQQKEMQDRTKRLYNQLEEVKQKKAYKAREVQKVDVQARRKEYGNKLLSRSKK